MRQSRAASATSRARSCTACCLRSPEHDGERRDHRSDQKTVEKPPVALSPRAKRSPTGVLDDRQLGPLELANEHVEAIPVARAEEPPRTALRFECDAVLVDVARRN